MGSLNIVKFAILFLLLLNLVNAATIHGTVYDLSLKKVNNAIVEIDTSPRQFMVAQNGSYSFNVPNGFYIIKSQLKQKNSVVASVQENITIKQEGNYVLDLILFPDIEEGIENIELDLNGDIIDEEKNKILSIVVLMIIFLGIMAIGYYYFIKSKKAHPTETVKEDKDSEKNIQDTDLNQLINVIKNEGGRTTQKDIRKQIPLSEAKISLMIAELEHKGIIEKIKKGRGNIIILKKSEK